MTLEFREYKKKIKKNIFLELDFKVSTGEILTIISNNTLELDSLKDSFKRRTKFKGEITFNNIDINEEKLIFSEDFGFYNHLSLEKNLLSLSKILGLTVPKDDIIGGLDLLELDPNKKYQQLLENEKIKFHTLFSVLINQNILILDYSKYNLTIPYEDIRSNHIINNRIFILNTLKIENIKLRMIIENNNFYLVNEEHNLFGKYVNFKDIERNINKYKKELLKEYNKNVLFFNI